MANQGGNPGFVTGQVPSAATWNAAWTTKADALIATTRVTGNVTVISTVAKLVVDTTSGNVLITVPPGLGQSGKENRVRIVKKSATPNANQVIVSPTASSADAVAFITSENNATGAGWLDIDANGTILTNFCGIP